MQDGARAFAQARERWAASRVHWKYGLENGTGELADLARRVDMLLSTEQLPAVLDLDVCAAAECMLLHATTLVWTVGLQAGAKDALVMKLRSHRYQSQTKTKQGVGWWWELAPGPSTLIVEPHTELRTVICAADDASYAAAREEASKLRTEPWIRALVDFCFPSEPAWANEDLEAALARATFTQQERMTAGRLASTNDFGLASFPGSLIAVGVAQLLVEVPGRWGAVARAAMQARLDRDPFAEIEAKPASF